MPIYCTKYTPFESADTFLKGIGKHKISYVLAWRNAGGKPGGQFEGYVPYKGHGSTDDFIKFYKLENTFFESDISNQKIYQ